MQRVLAEISVSMSELEKNPAGVISKAGGRPIAFLKRSKTIMYLLPAETYEALMDMIGDHELSKLVDERRDSKDHASPMSLDDL